MNEGRLIVRDLGLQPYGIVWQAMKRLTNERDQNTRDELWFVEHESVLTLGQASKPEHLLQETNIPVVQSDRGGQVTYHGPGQLILYPLIDIRRRGIGVREMVTILEQLVIQWLAEYGVQSYTKAEAPGVYVKVSNNDAKIASLGLRIRKGCCFHGVSININMDLSPFKMINPCGYEGLRMTQLSEFIPSVEPGYANIKNQLLELFVRQVGASGSISISNPLQILVD
ncbi:octanoyltransferase [Candidatus Endobugula sertula]|uniref:Octanoyltransferase n=1 Tax=Candidatus Endobugula sertula TaxID=62101 RepID=A0A1D2QT01_9GAMM|nr:octanoyltransferase [Candidatus Endobugula sertula]